MWKLLKQIAKDEEHGFALATNDFFRPDLKQIGNSVFEIRRYFVPEEGRTIKPLKLGTTLAKVKDCLLELVENHAFVLGSDQRTDEEVKNTHYSKTEPCFMFLSETLSVALDFTTSPRPSNAVCDVFIAFPTKPTMVLSLVDGDEESREALAYNTSVARGVRHKLIRFMDEDVNSIHGVINTSTLKDSVAFNTRLGVLANDSFHFVPTYSLLMNTRRYGTVLTAFWAGVAETKSVLRENGDANDDCIRFLTKEQCIILVENINSKDVQVRCVPGSGATTLMLEVARRLSRLGDTLLVCRSREERDRLRSAYASVVSVNDLSKLDLSSYVNIVDETNSVTPETRRHHWQFANYLTDIKQIKYRKWMIERETDSIEKLMDVFTNDHGRRRLKYLLGEIDVLVLMMEKLRPHIAFQFHQNKDSLENKPRQQTSDNTSTGAGSFFSGNQHPVLQETEQVAWQEKVEQEKNVFPLLRSVMEKDRTNLVYQGVKLAYLEKAISGGEEKLQQSSQSSESKFWTRQNTARAFQETLTDAKHELELQNTDGADAEGYSETIYVTRENKRNVSSSTEPLEDIHTEDKLELQDTDVCEALELQITDVGEALELQGTDVGEALELQDTDAGEALELQDTDAGETLELQDTDVGQTQELQDTVGEAQKLQDTDVGEALEFQDTDVGETQELQDTDVGEALELQDTDVGEAQDLQDTDVGEAQELQDTDVGEAQKLQDTDVGEAQELQDTDVGEAQKLQITDVGEALELQDTDVGEAQDLQDTDVGEAQELQDTDVGEAQELQDTDVGEAQKLQDTDVGEAQNLQDTYAGEALELQGTDVGEAQELQDTDVGEAQDLQDTDVGEAQELQDTDVGEAQELQDTDVGETQELQDTDVGEAESRMQEIESLNEELDSLKSNRDYKTRQLDKLQTKGWTLVEWQNAVDYLMRYPDVLSLFNVELPGLDSVSSFQREDQDEGNLPRTIKHKRGTVFTKYSKRKLPDTISKLAGVKGEGQYTAKDGCHSPYRSTGLMHQLRRYQLGSLKDRDLTTLTLKVMTEDEQRLAYLTAKNSSLEKNSGRTLHIVGLECRPAPVSCPKRHLDAARANTRFCHVTTDGELVNSEPDKRDEGRNRLQKYLGTCSSPIPLPPHPSTLTPLPTTPTYWETETRVRVGERLWWHVLEMGVVEAGQVDSEGWVSQQRCSWCVSVERCNRHEGSICTTVWREGEPGECHQNTMSDTPGTQATLHYGVVLDVGRGRVTFTDLDRGIVLVKYDEVFREPLVPVFSAGWSSSGYTVSMSLISGEDVDMTDTKRALVYQALR